MSALRFRKRPVEVEAIQWTGDNLQEIVEWADPLEDDTSALIGLSSGRLVILTLEGEMYAPAGWWVIRGVQGEYYPCKPDIFEATYERVSS